MDRAQLEAMALEKISKMETVPSSSMDRAALEQMALEKLSTMEQTPVDNETEASIGTLNRAQYAIEPIQSNRKAFLEREFGQENIMEDKNGELYLKQNGSFLPLNKGGLSAADAADFAGALPETVGGVVGTVAGAVGGAGALSVPGAIGLGVAGGAVGSAARQALSGAIGTPQVATMGERATETGLSGAFGGVGAGAGLAIKAGVNKVKPGISQIIKNLTRPAGETVEQAAETTAKTLSETSGQLTGNVTPIFNELSEKGITGEVADQSGRGMVKNEAKKLAEISSREGIPKATYAQAAQGKALIAEAKVMDTPLIGGKVRKQVDGQVAKIRDNLEGITGKFVDIDSDAFEVGATMREMAETMIDANKKASSELYEAVEEEMAGAVVSKRSVYNTFRDFAGDFALVTPGSSESEYIATKGLTRTEFKNIQEIVFDGLKALRLNSADEISFDALNGIKKTLKNSVEELKDSNPNSARILKKLVDKVEDRMEVTLRGYSPGTAEKLKAANQGWRKFYEDSDKLNSIIKNGNLDDEKIVKTVMSGTKNIEKMKELIGEDRVKEIGKTYLRDILAPLGKSGIARADSAMTAIKKQRAQLVAAIGEENYSRVISNLYFLNRTGQPLSVSRASLYNILDNRGPGLKGLAVNLAGAAKTIAESKGTTITKATAGKVFETTSKVVPTTSKGLSGAANLLGDDSQRAASSFRGGSRGSVAERERQKEAEKRKRAISGSK